MVNQNELPILALDFDGVICDSVIECMHTAYISSGRHEEESWPILSDEYIYKFKILRPYAKSGEDFILIDNIISENINILNEDEFLKYKNKFEDILPGLSDNYYSKRKQIQDNDINYWLKINPLYDGIKENISKLEKFFNIFIVTTKDEYSVSKILEFYGIDFRKEKIFGRDRKLTKKQILKFFQEKYKEQIFFVEDNFTALLEVEDLNINRVLASWGYVNRSIINDENISNIHILILKNFYNYFFSHAK